MSEILPHYSPVLRVGSHFYISGQLPIIDRATRAKPEGYYSQTILALEKAENLISSFGLDRTNMVKTTCYVVGGEGWDECNRAYHDFFQEHKPARSIVPVPSLHFDCLVEVEGIAVLGDD